MTRVASPLLRQCPAPQCRAWKSVDLDVCPYCDRPDRRARMVRWFDRVVVVVSLGAAAAVVYNLNATGLI